MHRERRIADRVPDGRANLGSDWHADHRTGITEGLSAFSEDIYLVRRTFIALRVPLAASSDEIDPEHSIVQASRGGAIVVRPDF
jgi:hypothetical protein